MAHWNDVLLASSMTMSLSPIGTASIPGGFEQMTSMNTNLNQFAVEGYVVVRDRGLEFFQSTRHCSYPSMTILPPRPRAARRRPLVFTGLLVVGVPAETVCAT